MDTNKKSEIVWSGAGTTRCYTDSVPWATWMAVFQIRRCWSSLNCYNSWEHLRTVITYPHLSRHSKESMIYRSSLFGGILWVGSLEGKHGFFSAINMDRRGLIFHCLPAQSCALEVCVKAQGVNRSPVVMHTCQPELDKEKQTLIYMFCHKLIWICWSIVQFRLGNEHIEMHLRFLVYIIYMYIISYVRMFQP